LSAAPDNGLGTAALLERRARARRLAAWLGLLALAIYGGFIVMQLLARHHG
jgi:hypothetical protein